MTKATTLPVAPNLPNARVITAAAGLLVIGLWGIGTDISARQAALYGLGAIMGLVLYHATFGFAASWRAFLTGRDGAGVRAQVVMLALASIVFLPVLDGGTFFGSTVSGAVAPAGISVAVGAFLFGIGMQLGGACASGTLYTAGGGNIRMGVTLVFFILGSLIGTAHLPWWAGLPALPARALPGWIGLAPALALQLGVLGMIYVAALRIAPTRTDSDPAAKPVLRLHRLLHGPWPLMWGAILLATLNIATLAIAHHPWSVTFAFSLWGAKAAAAIGIDVASWEFWTWPYPARALGAPVLADTTSVMDIGILIGAFLAAGLAGRFAPVFRIGARPLLAALIGGLLLGYGARLAYGCNIGALFSGIASGSLHGWLWLITALGGNMIGMRLRPWFRLAL